jgi:lactoylglutathione lyase
MKRLLLFGACLTLLAPSSPAAAASAVKTVSFEDLHIHVPDPAKAGEWYVKHLGALPTTQPHRVSFGRFLIIFGKGGMATSTSIDHLGLSFADLDTKLKEVSAAGAKVTTPMRDAPGLFKLAFVEDPFGVRIELVQDAEHLGIHHVHLRVPDPDATIQWYQDVFGGERKKLKGRLDGLLYDTIPPGYAGVSNSAKAGKVWLLATKGEKMAQTDDTIIWDLAFQVEDIKQAVEGFKSKGAPVTREPRVAKIAGNDTGVVFTRDPNGILIELLVRPKVSTTY